MVRKLEASQACTAVVEGSEFAVTEVSAAREGPHARVRVTFQPRNSSGILGYIIRWRMNSATSPLEPQAAHPHIVDDLKFGRKYYFLVETQLANPPYIAPSRASDPLEIQCPAFACCDRGPSCPLEMPEGATVAELVPQQGAYRVSNVTFAPCLNAGACLNSGCGEGYGGLLCHRCIPGYARSGMHDCRPCDAGSVAFIIFGILVSICICVYFIRSTLESSEKTMEIEMFKIGLSGMQALTVLGRMSSS